MGQKRLLSAINGKTTTVEFLPDGNFLIHSYEDVAPLLDNNKMLRNDRVVDKRSEMRHVADIPATVIHKWLQEGIDVWSGEHQKEVAQKLNDPDWRYLRTGGGHIGAVGDGTYR